MVSGRARYNVRVRNLANRGTSRSHMRKPQRISHVSVRRPSRSRVGLWKAEMGGTAGFPEEEPCATCQGKGAHFLPDPPHRRVGCEACEGTGLEHVAQRASLDDPNRHITPHIGVTEPESGHAGERPYAHLSHEELKSQIQELIGTGPENTDNDEQFEALVSEQELRNDEQGDFKDDFQDVNTGEPMEIAMLLLKEALDTPKSGFTDTDDYPHRAAQTPRRTDRFLPSRPKEWHNITGVAQPEARARQFYESLPYGTLGGWSADSGHAGRQRQTPPFPRPMWPLEGPEFTTTRNPKSRGRTRGTSFEDLVTAAEAQGVDREAFSRYLNNQGMVSRTPVHRSVTDDDVWQTKRETANVFNPYRSRQERPGWDMGREQKVGRVGVREPSDEENELWGMRDAHEPVRGVLTDVDATGDPDWWKNERPSVMSGGEI